MLYSKKKWLAFVFLIPFFVIVGMFIIYPAILNIYNGFFSFKNRLDPNPEYIGFSRNLKWLFEHKPFWRSLGNTFILVGLVIVFQVGIALILALMVNEVKIGKQAYRVIFFAPIVIAAAAIGTMYRMMIAPTGLFTQIMGKSVFDWLPLGSPLSYAVVVFPVLWQYIGFYFVIMLTGLTNICEDYMEAAKLDGANTMQRIWFITLPMLWNVFRTCMVLAITGALKVFDMPHIIAPNGAPDLQTIFMGTYINWLNEQGKYSGQVSVYALVMVVVGIAISGLSNTVLRENKDI